jgi:ankyrin repeat protein
MLFACFKPGAFGSCVCAIAIALSSLILWPIAGTPASAQSGPAADEFLSFLEIVKAGNVDGAKRRLYLAPTLVAGRDQQYGATALHWAAAGGDQTMVAILLERGADPCARNAKGMTPAEVAVRNRCTGFAVAVLCPSEPLEPLLFTATQEGDVPTVERLLNMKPTMVNAADSIGATPLHWAAYKGYAGMTLCLIENGANATARNRNGKTPLQVAASQQSVGGIINSTAASTDGMLAISLMSPTIGMVMAHQQLSNQIQSQTLANDVARRYDAVIRILEQPEYQRGPDQAMMKAAREGNMVALRRLLRSNPALVHVTDPVSGETPLHAAAANGCLEAVSLLLRQGADPAKLDSSGRTALQTARLTGGTEIVELLKARTASRDSMR